MNAHGAKDDVFCYLLSKLCYKGRVTTKPCANYSGTVLPRYVRSVDFSEYPGNNRQAFFYASDRRLFSTLI